MNVEYFPPISRCGGKRELTVMIANPVLNGCEYVALTRCYYTILLCEWPFGLEISCSQSQSTLASHERSKHDGTGHQLLQSQHVNKQRNEHWGSSVVNRQTDGGLSGLFAQQRRQKDKTITKINNKRDEERGTSAGTESQGNDSTFST